MWYRRIYQRKQSLLSKRHLVHNFLRNVNHLYNIELFEAGLDFFLSDLDIFELLWLVVWADWFDHLINIILNGSLVHGKQVLKGVSNMFKVNLRLLLHAS